ncbi:MAG: UbiA family prenyltransferase, partial [Planctomycetota bacterium]
MHQSWSPTIPLIFLLLSSAAIYTAGMVLNDYFDFEKDLVERPERPIPSGQISRKATFNFGFALLVGGVACAAIAGLLAQASSGLAVSRSTGIALILVIFVVLYDGPAKSTWLAPFIMGTCRFFNLLLGASTIDSSQFIPTEF